METAGDTGASISETRILLIPRNLDGKRLKVSMPLPLPTILHKLRVGHQSLHRTAKLRLIESEPDVEDTRKCLLDH